MKRILLSVIVCLLACRGGPCTAQNAVSREVTTYVGQFGDLPVNNAISREVSVLNYPTESLPVNSALSREVSIYAGPAGELPVNSAISREVSFNNDPWVLIPENQAVSREVSSYLTPYSFAELTQALRVAAGLNPSSADERVRLDVVIIPPSFNLVDILDAARIMYLQSVAPPAEDG